MSTDPADARMASLYDGGASIRQTATACGRPPKTVHRRLAAAGIPRRSPGGGSPRQGQRFRPTEDQKQKIKAAYDDGKGDVSLHDLGAAYRVSGDTIARLLRSMDVTLRPRGTTIAAAAAPPRPAMLELHSQGFPPRDIAARLHDENPAEIARQLRHAGLVPHRRRPLLPPAELAVAYAHAGSVRVLNSTLRVGEDRLRAALQEAGVPAGSLRDLPAAARPEVARMAAAGVPQDRIASLTGISPDLLAQVGRPRTGGRQVARAA